MAKRKRLGPARVFSDTPDVEPVDLPEEAELETKAVFPKYPLGVAQHRPKPKPKAKPAPIASVAGQTASDAALEELAEAMRSAREEGRLIQPLPLDAIEADHLVRDRLAADEEEMQTLIQSIRTRGQQTPIEVVALEGGRYGLISGWRRLTALRRLVDDDARFGTVLAVLRRPETAADAYCAMVEENEIRVGLSYYERARIVARAAQQGVYEDSKAALSGLFSSASRPKRSKIGSFVRLHDALDDVLRFPSAIPERLGLALVKAIETEEGFADRLRARLREAGAGDPEAEQALLSRALDRAETPSAAKPAAPETKTADGPPVRIRMSRGKITLTGPGVTGELGAALRDWIADRGL